MRFIRKNGHVIPIRDSQAPKQAAKNTTSPGHSHTKAGAALTGAGVGVAAGSGVIAGHMVQEAAGAENKARSLIKFYSAAKASQGALKDGDKLVKRTRMLFRENMRLRNQYWKGSLATRHTGFLAGSALVGLGVERGLRDAPGFEDKPEARTVVAGGAALATHFAIRSAFVNRVAPKTEKRFINAALFVARGLFKGRT